MKLRFKLYSAAGTTALLAAPSSDAFAPAAFQQRTIASRTRAVETARRANLNPDWDNDDFLSSLGGGEEEMEEANAKYYKQAESRAAMDEWRARKFDEQLRQKPNANASSPTTELPPPGYQSQQQMRPPPLQQNMQHPTPQIAQPPEQTQMRQQQPPPQQQQFYDANGNPVSLPMIYDQNGDLVPFNPQQPQMHQQPSPQQSAQPQMPPQINPGPAIVEPPLPPKTKGTDSPRPVGYNPDAYAMSNTADVYFAQLKQDSKVRKMARISGDLETANKVFMDESVRQIGESWNDNPYTKEKNLAEARAEIESTVRAQTQEDDTPAVSKGISYKDRLATMRNKRAAGGGVSGTPQSAEAAALTLPKAEPSVAAAPLKAKPPKVAMSAPPKVEQPVTKAPLVTSTTPPPVAVTPPTKAAAAAAVPAIFPEEVRGKVRTLQGLLLKHRGGPGFGAGRLKTPEAQRLEETLEEVKGILRSEIGKRHPKHVTAVAPTPPAVESKPPLAAAPTAPAVEAKYAKTSKIAAVVPPPPLQKVPAAPAVPAPTQAATMLSQFGVVGGPPDPLAGSVACVEAALQLYKESSPMDRGAMVIPLREALMAAASASNKYIAESELMAHNEVMVAGPPPAVEAAQPMMGFPTTYAVTKPEQEEESVRKAVTVAATAPVMDQAENERKLEDAYNALLQAGGEGGKLGLKKISSDEARALADKLVAMRGVLLDELNSGS